MSQFPPLYLTISRTVNAPRRLAALRTSGISDWRKARSWTLENGANAFGALSQGKSGNDAIWYCCTGPQFRNERFADDVDGGPDHTGWFTDSECSRKIRGIVASLTHGRFIAGTYSTDNGMRAYWPEVYTDESDAARAADSQAESDADDEREHNDRWQEAHDLREKISESIERLRSYLVGRNDARLASREFAEIEIANIRGYRETLTNDYSDIEI